MRKVTPRLAAEIRKRRAKGETIGALAKRFSLSLGTIHATLTKKAVAGVAPPAPRRRRRRRRPRSPRRTRRSASGWPARWPTSGLTARGTAARATPRLWRRRCAA